MDYQKLTQRRDYYKNYEISNQHPCLNCGKLCGRKAKRCSNCASKERGKILAPLYKKPPKLCIDCGKQIQRVSIRCRSCRTKYRWSEKGANSFNMITGKIWHTKGYVLIYKPDHPKAKSDGSIYEHRYIWEQIHGKFLPEGWVVHHLNGIRHDNRPSNLIALPNQKHNTILYAKGKRIQELEALLRQQNQLF
jgi:hypothetical protein